MITHNLRRKDKISHEDACRLIMMMAKRSNNYLEVFHQVTLQTDEDVKSFFSRGSGSFEELVEQCRNYNEPIPIVENIIGSLFVTNGTAVITSTYRNLYETASEALERAVKNVSYADFQSAVMSGVASAEAYLNHRAEKWNQQNPNDQLIDSRAQKVSLDAKIDLWIPKMTNGRKLDKGFRNWSDFKRLRGLRDNVTAHPKQTSFTRTVYEIAEGIGMFKTGIAGLLIQLHDLFDEKIPSIIIRGFFAPDIEVLETGL